jgi:hypothetical protein
MNSSSEITPNSGQQANLNGDTLEHFVECLLQARGYVEFINYKGQVFAMRKAIGGKQYSKQPFCGYSIYETQRKCDFLTINQSKFPNGLIIECKWQQTSGSVDEKYPFTVHNIEKTKIPSIIVIGGEGYKKEALEWLKKQSGKDKALIGVYTMSEFQSHVNTGFLG